MLPEIINAISAVFGALVGASAAIIAANPTLKKQLSAQESKHRKEQQIRAH
jgi:hypothetical protein